MSNFNTSQNLPQFFLRPATESDLPSCRAIYRQYVLNTTIAFLLNDPPLKYISDRYHATLTHGLPYLVAVAFGPAHASTSSKSTSILTAADSLSSPLDIQPLSSSTTTTSGTDTATRSDNIDTGVDDTKILGFTHASPFSASKAGYAPSVELTLFCAPDHVGKGIGSALLTRLLADLKTCQNVHWEEGHESDDQKIIRDVPVRNVFAVVSQDLVRREGAGEARGEEIVKWYCGRFGFRVVGRLEGVGWKFGREVDVVYLQKRLL